MSSLSQSLATPNRTSRLPVRQASVAHSESRSSSSSGHALTPQSSISGEIADDHYLSPYRASSARSSFQFGHPGSSEQPDEQHTAFTFRSLHNVTPQPSSPEPIIERLATFHPQEEAVELSASALPILPTAVPELPQPLHTLYSDEKIAIGGGNDESRTGVPYNVRDETCPAKPFFDQVFQEALGHGIAIAERTLAALERVAGPSGLQGDLKRLRKDAKALSDFESSDTRTIGVLGASGEGKSSLINSLLHFPEIARTGDIGAACTSVVTEYRHKTRDHIAPITIEAEYLSNPDIEELIKELLWNYRQLFLPEIEQDSVSAQDYARYVRESAQAWSALEAASKHQNQFSEGFLRDMSEGALERISQQLIQWTRELVWPEGGDSGRWTSTACTAEECCEKTSIFMNDRFWPFTKIIRVYLSAQVLKTGVVLADLPGLQDTNLARVRATQTYLMRCDHVFIVAKISRAITDQSLQSSLFDVLTRHVPLEWEESAGKRLKVSVVCTRSEDLNKDTARRDFCGPGGRIAQSDMERLDESIQRAREDRDWDRKKDRKNEQLVLLMAARNQHVKDGLQRAYASKVPGGRLEVFCVSNTIYDKYCKRGNATMVQASGVPELRRFCHSITADAQLLEAKHFLRSTLSSLLNSVELWTCSLSDVPQTSDQNAKELIYETFQGSIAQVSKANEESRMNFSNAFQDHIMSLAGRGQIWTDDAGARASQWRNWHWSQYNAWCLNDGIHQTPRRSFVNWNAELVWKMRSELEYQWDLVEDEIPIVFRGLLQVTKAPLDFLESLIRAHGLPHALSEGIKFRVDDIEYQSGLIEQELTREVKLIRLKASEPNTSSYILGEMIPAYRLATQESGTGKAARQRSIVQGRITNGTLFPNITNLILNSINDLVRIKFQAMRAKASTMFDLIKDDLDMALATRVADESEGHIQVTDESVRMLKGEVGNLRRRHEESLRSIIEF